MSLERKSSSMSPPASALALDPRHAALLVMDYQNDIVATVESHYLGLLDRAAYVLNAARTARIPVFYVVVRFRDGYPEVSPRNRVFSVMRASGRLLDGTPGAEIHPRVAPLPNE